MKFLKNIFKKIPKRFKNKKTLAAVVTLLLVAFFGLRGGANEDLIKTAKVEKGTIKSEVFATGKIESESQSSLNFAVSGRVVFVSVKEGDYVKKGQVIASLDREKFEIALRQAQQDVVAADAKLEKVYDDLPDNRIESFQDKINRTAAEATKNQAFDAVKLAERNLKDTTLTSPIDGTIIELNVKAGEEVSAAEIAAKVADTASINFISEIDETDIGSISEGQNALIHLDAYPDQEINSKVQKVSSFGTTIETEATVFEVEFAFPAEDKFIIGMNGDIQITTEEKENVLSIPVEALVGENIVYLRKNGQYIEKEVEVGIQNDSQAEIISGIEEGETVVIEGFDEIGKKNLIQKLLRK